jgi:hypothetical protein
MVLKADRLAVAHPPDMRVAGLHLAAGLGLAAKGADHDEVLAGVDKGIWLGLELIEVSGTFAKTSLATLSAPLKVPCGARPPPGSCHSICASKASKTAGTSPRLNAS